MDGRRGERLQGTLELLVLKILSGGPVHGWGIGQRIQQISGDVFQVNQGSLYSALQRMRAKTQPTTQSGRSVARRCFCLRLYGIEPTRTPPPARMFTNAPAAASNPAAAATTRSPR